MKEILTHINGILYERAIQKGMKTENRQYDFGNYEVKCKVNITEDKIETKFYVLPSTFAKYSEAVYETNSFKELRHWLQEHIEEIK